MEAHPVPKNVSSFEFHLVGDMTLKQFTYLASGLAVAYLAFVFFAKPLPVIAWPLIVLSSGIGAAFAFIPISQRPLDHWLLAYLKAIFSPTKYSFAKSKRLESPQVYENRLNFYLSSLNQTPIPQIPVATLPQPAPVAPQPIQHAAQPQREEALPKPTQTPSSRELEKTVELAKEAQVIQTQIIQSEQQLSQIKAEAAKPGTDVQEFTQKFQRVLANLQTLNKQATEISHNLAMLAKTPTTPKPRVKTEPVKNIQTMSLTSTPNVINGIVTDAQGNYMENAIIVAHDKQGLPVRALKSNKLGQFIAATPLSNGIYILSTEKESLSFNSVEVELKNEILKPIVISAIPEPNLVPAQA